MLSYADSYKFYITIYSEEIRCMYILFLDIITKDRLKHILCIRNLFGALIAEIPHSSLYQLWLHLCRSVVRMILRNMLL